MKRLITLLPLAVLTLLFASGCATLTKGPNQSVPINSNPRGATVKVNGEEVGQTPMTAQLPRTRNHTVVLEKEHYRPHTQELMPVTGKASESFIRFTIDERSGAHTDLTPGRINVTLVPEILPAEIGENPVSELATIISDLDDQLAAGELSRDDHRFIMQRLFRFYQQ